MADSAERFDYALPEELIAQYPAARRDASRMLVLDRDTGTCRHARFADFPDLLEPGDVLIRNTSRVLPARLSATRTNGRPAEILLVHPDRDDTWLAMVHPGGKLKAGRTLTVAGDTTLEVVEVLGGGLRRLRRSGPLDWQQLMERHGVVPLPPYIRRPPDATDDERYQTVFAQEPGSIAAPTSGLHFTPDILERLVTRGIHIHDVVLHVGPGTFKPVQTEHLEDHRMHAEWYRIEDDTARAVNGARKRGARIWAVGTTVTRVLETVGPDGTLRPEEGWTDLFIRPPFTFRIVDALLTNFHLPRSTLLMLVCAFAGYDPAMAAYRAAVEERYRFYSYGDAMVIR